MSVSRRESDREREEERLQVYWVNSINAPHCLLVDSYQDLLDGMAVWEILRKFENVVGAKKKTLQSAIDWLGKKYGWTMLPPFLARREAAEMIALGENRGMRDLIRFLREQYEGPSNNLFSSTSSSSSQDNDRDTKDIISRQKKYESRRSRRKPRFTTKIQRQRPTSYRHDTFSSSSSHRRYRKSHTEEKPQWNGSSTFSSSSHRRYDENHAKQRPQWNGSTSMINTKSKMSRKSATTEKQQQQQQHSIDHKKGIFKLNDMIDPTYVPRKIKSPEKKKTRKKKKKKKKKRFPKPPIPPAQILSPQPRSKAPSSTSIRRPVYPIRVSTKLTLEQVNIVAWISNMYLTHWIRGGSQNVPDSWKIISDCFRNGLLLCEMVEHIFNVSCSPPCPRPRSTVDSVRNIRFAMDALRQLGVQSTWLWSSEAIERGAYPEPLFGLLHDLRESVEDDENMIQQQQQQAPPPHVIVRPSNQQNDKVRRVVRWIRSLGLDQELLGLVDDKELRRTYRQTRRRRHHQDEFLADPIRNGLLLTGLASVLCSRSGLEPPYRRPLSLQQCETNLVCALRALQDSNFLENDIDCGALACSISLGQGDTLGDGEGTDGMAWELFDQLMITMNEIMSSSYGNRNNNKMKRKYEIGLKENKIDLGKNENTIFRHEVVAQEEEEEEEMIEDQDILQWLDQIGFVKNALSNDDEDEFVLPTLPALIRESHIRDGVWFCNLVSVCSGKIVKPAVATHDIVSERSALSNFHHALRHLIQEPHMSQRSLHPEETIAELLHYCSLSTWRRILRDCYGLYEKIVGKVIDVEEEEEKEEDPLSLNDLAGHRKKTQQQQQEISSDEIDLLQELKVKGVSSSSAIKMSSRKKMSGAEDQIEILTLWLSSLDIHLQRSLSDEILLDFTDGTLLCRLAELLDHSTARGGIHGVEEHPRSGAAKLNNIRKALNVFRKRKNFPLDFLWSEMRIREGDGQVIRNLLMHARKAYGHHLGNKKKKKMSKSTRMMKPGFMARRRNQQQKKSDDGRSTMRKSKKSLSMRWRR